MQKCENCLHKKDCIDGANFKNAEKCKRFVLDADVLKKSLDSCRQSGYDNCPQCIFNGKKYCFEKLNSAAYDLVNYYQAEIKKLQEHIKKCDMVEQRADELIAQLQKELKIAKSEAVKEFAERLKRKSQLMALSVYAEPERAVFISDIDNLEKEMTEKGGGEEWICSQR